MTTGRLVFTKICDTIDRKQFQQCVFRHPMPRTSRSFTARDQFLCMAFAQLTDRESLRDIEACLELQASLLNEMGIRGAATRTKLANASEHQNWEVYFEPARILIRKARNLYSTDRYILEIDVPSRRRHSSEAKTIV